MDDDFIYMYNDGYATEINVTGGNRARVPGNTSGCWGHRENILHQWVTRASTGYTVQMGLRAFLGRVTAPRRSPVP